MAEFVEQRMQYMIPELEELEKLQILSPNEVGKLVQKRREYEYKITKRQRKKQDYINYVLYDTKLLELLFIRRTELGEKNKHSVIEGTICKRILQRLSFMTKLWPSHLDIWALRISFSKARGFEDGVSTIYAEQARFHGNLESVWVAWADWEIMQRSNFIKARDILLSKAKRYHPNSVFISREYFRLELLYIRHLGKNSKIQKSNHEIAEESKEKILDCSVPEAIYKDTIENFKSMDVYIQFYEVVERFPFAKALKETIFKDLMSAHPNGAITWKLRLKESLLTKYKGADEQLQLLNPKQKIDKIFEFYDQAKHTVGESFLDIYFNENLNLLYQTWITKNLFKDVTHKMVTLCEEFSDRLSTFQFKTWFYLSKYTKCPSKDIKFICSTAAVMHPHNSAIQLELIKLLLSDENDDNSKMKVFENNKKSFSDANGLIAWIVLIESLNENTNKILMLEKGAHNICNEIAVGIRVYYLNFIFKHKGVKSLRRIYKQFAFAPPLSNDLHATYINQELKSRFHSVDEVRKAFDNAVMQFGTNTTGVWFSYIEFERKYGNKNRIGHLTTEARDKLKPKNLCHFIDLRYVFEHQVENDNENIDSKANDNKCFIESENENERKKKEKDEEFIEDFCVRDAICQKLFLEAPFLKFSENNTRKEFFKLIWDSKYSLNEYNPPNSLSNNKDWEALLSFIMGENISLSIKEIKSDLIEDDTQKCVELLNEICHKKSKKHKKVDNDHSLVFDSEISTSATSINEINEILSHSDVLQEDFLKKKTLEPYFIKKVILKRRNKKLSKNPIDAGDGWFNMKRPEMTTEIQRDMQVLNMRSALDPKTHYKRNDLKEIPKVFQMGKVVDNPLDFYSSRITKKERKRTLAEELISDEKTMMYTKRKHAEIVSKLRTKQRLNKTSKKREKTLKNKNRETLNAKNFKTKNFKVNSPKKPRKSV